MDVIDESINKVDPKCTLGASKAAFSCYSDVTEDGPGSNCNGAFFKKGNYLFTHRNYFEIKQNAMGKLTTPLMGFSLNNLFRTLENPEIKDIHWDAFQMRCGVLFCTKINPAKNKIP